jgi:hypothetical protein
MHGEESTNCAGIAVDSEDICSDEDGGAFVVGNMLITYYHGAGPLSHKAIGRHARPVGPESSDSRELVGTSKKFKISVGGEMLPTESESHHPTHICVPTSNALRWVQRI